MATGERNNFNAIYMYEVQGDTALTFITIQ